MPQLQSTRLYVLENFSSRLVYIGHCTSRPDRDLRPMIYRRFLTSLTAVVVKKYRRNRPRIAVEKILGDCGQLIYPGSVRDPDDRAALIIKLKKEWELTVYPKHYTSENEAELLRKEYQLACNFANQGYSNVNSRFQ